MSTNVTALASPFKLGANRFGTALAPPELWRSLLSWLVLAWLERRHDILHPAVAKHGQPHTQTKPIGELRQQEPTP